jgi:hypothetical protein
MAPLGPDDRIVMQQGSSCRPWFDYCLFGSPYCSRVISIEFVLQAASETIPAVPRLLPASKAGPGLGEEVVNSGNGSLVC